MGRYKDITIVVQRAAVTTIKKSDWTSRPQPNHSTPSRPGPRGPASASQVVGATTESLGTVKMYKSDKGFGFVGQDDGGKDVFVHATALARAGLSELTEGQRVRMQIGQGKKGLEAQTIELLD